jgi:metallophosphoesterase (TIGR00282 family)
MKILFIADIVGSAGRKILSDRLAGLCQKETPDFIIANAENAAGGKGLTRAISQELFTLGINVLTMGNHTFDRKEIVDFIDDPRILRPANYPPGVPGQGWGVYATSSNEPIAVINLMGRVYLPLIDCPFRAADAVIEKIRLEAKVIFVDMHAEVTSEKSAITHYVDGRVTAVVGTHTHVPTADEMVRPSGTAALTDAGMTGPSDGVIGMDRDTVLRKFLTGTPQHFVEAAGSAVLQGCIVDADAATGLARSIRRFSISDRGR